MVSEKDFSRSTENDILTDNNTLKNSNAEISRHSFCRISNDANVKHVLRFRELLRDGQSKGGSLTTSDSTSNVVFMIKRALDFSVTPSVIVSSSDSKQVSGSCTPKIQIIKRRLSVVASAIELVRLAEIRRACARRSLNYYLGNFETEDDYNPLLREVTKMSLDIILYGRKNIRRKSWSGVIKHQLPVEVGKYELLCNVKIRRQSFA